MMKRKAAAEASSKIDQIKAYERGLISAQKPSTAKKAGCAHKKQKTAADSLLAAQHGNTKKKRTEAQRLKSVEWQRQYRARKKASKEAAKANADVISISSGDSQTSSTCSSQSSVEIANAPPQSIYIAESKSANSLITNRHEQCKTTATIEEATKKLIKLRTEEFELLGQEAAININKAARDFLSQLQMPQATGKDEVRPLKMAKASSKTEDVIKTRGKARQYAFEARNDGEKRQRPRPRPSVSATKASSLRAASSSTGVGRILRQDQDTSQSTPDSQETVQASPLSTAQSCPLSEFASQSEDQLDTSQSSSASDNRNCDERSTDAARAEHRSVHFLDSESHFDSSDEEVASSLENRTSSRINDERPQGTAGPAHTPDPTSGQSSQQLLAMIDRIADMSATV